MNKKMKKYLSVILVITILLSGVIFVTKNTIFKKEDRFNISYLPDEFVEEYFEEVSKADSDEEKENMLIVISDSKIKDSYGAKNIIEAPNNQYILGETKSIHNKVLMNVDIVIYDRVTYGIKKIILKLYKEKIFQDDSFFKVFYYTRHTLYRWKLSYWHASSVPCFRQRECNH